MEDKIEAKGTGEEKEKKRPYSNSSITTFQQCERKFYLAYRKCYQSKAWVAQLEFGGALHKCLATLYTTGRADAERFITEYSNPPHEEVRTQVKLRKVVDKYAQEKFPVPWDETLGVEKELEFMAGVHRFICIPDVVIKWRGGIYAVEHKHTLNLYDNFFTKFKRDTQIDAQMLSIKDKYGRCDGVYVNGIVIRKGGPTAKKPDVEFVMDLITRTPEELEESRKYFEGWAEDIMTMDFYDQGEQMWKENRRSCFDYNSACPFLPYCMGKVEKPDEYYNIKQWRYEVKCD